LPGVVGRSVAAWERQIELSGLSGLLGAWERLVAYGTHSKPTALCFSQRSLPQDPCGHRALILDDRGLERLEHFGA
jgi:hypothetical protein